LELLVVAAVVGRVGLVGADDLAARPIAVVGVAGGQLVLFAILIGVPGVFANDLAIIAFDRVGAVIGWTVVPGAGRGEYGVMPAICPTVRWSLGSLMRWISVSTYASCAISWGMACSQAGRWLYICPFMAAMAWRLVASVICASHCCTWDWICICCAWNWARLELPAWRGWSSCSSEYPRRSSETGMKRDDLDELDELDERESLLPAAPETL